MQFPLVLGYVFYKEHHIRVSNFNLPARVTSKGVSDGELFDCCIWFVNICVLLCEACEAPEKVCFQVFVGTINGLVFIYTFE